MRQIRLTRRGYSTAVGAGLVAALAGCTGEDELSDEDADDSDPGDADDSDPEDADEESADDTGDAESDDDDDGLAEEEIESEYGPVGILTVFLENGDGEPVSADVELMITHDVEDIGSGVTEGINDGEVDVEMYEEGPYTVRVESTADEFEPVEDGLTVEGDEETTMVLEGATGDGEDE